MLISILLAALLAGAENLESAPIDAACWKNLALRPFDDRRVLLLMFRLGDSETGALIDRLNRLSRRRDLWVIGVTPDSCAATERFVEKKRIRFAVGAESKASKRVRTRLPALFLIERGGRQTQWRGVQPESLDEIFKPQTIAVPDFTGSVPQSDLVDFVDSDADGQPRADAVRKLAELFTREEFEAFAQPRLANEPDPWVRGAFEFVRRKLAGETLPDEQKSESARLLRDYNDQPGDARWHSVREFFEQHGSMSAAELSAAYAQHAGAAPASVLIRRIAVDALKESADRETARRLLLEVAARDPDESIRLFAVMGLSDVSAPGDDETADLLDELASIEPNILRVRPMMQYVAFYLRTGVEDAREMPVPNESP